MKKKCVIIGSMPVGKAVSRRLPQDAFIIAADAGWQRAKELGLEIDLILGDFDSSPKPLNVNAKVLVLPAEKDDTDMMYAIKQALERGFKNITLIGAWGGRADHSIANLQALLYIAQNGAEATLISENVQMYCMAAGSMVLQAKEKHYLSVFAAGGVAKGVCLEGVKYPLHDAVLTPDVPLGVSNEIVETQASITCDYGYLYVMQVKKD